MFSKTHQIANSLKRERQHLPPGKRAGIFIPQDNVEDLEDVAEEVKRKLNIIPVTMVTEILQQTGIQ